jgi:prevent-host-death family protein
MKQVAAAKFKATCLTLMEQVAETREPIEVTKRGKPLVVLVPARARRVHRTIFGAARQSILHVAPVEELLSTGATWNAGR